MQGEAQRQTPTNRQSQARVPTIRPVSQVLLLVRTKKQGTTAFDVARNTVLDFIEQRAGVPLPKDAREGKSFELEEIGAQRTAAVALDTPRYWSARLDDADKNVAQRSWIIEVGLGELSTGAAVLGCRLLCATRGDHVAFDRTVPRFVRTLIESEQVELDGQPVGIAPWIVADENDVDDLVALLTNKARRSDVIVFSLPDGSVDGAQTIANARNVAFKTAGAAHVAIITGPASYILSDRVGREFSVFRQAVRTYKPNFDPELDELFKHPLALPHRILNWLPNGAPAYEGLLVSQAMIRTVSGGDFADRVPAFSIVRRKAAEHRLASAQSAGSSDSDLLLLAEEEIAALRRSLDEERETSGGLLKAADEERDKSQNEAAQIQAFNVHLRHRIQELEQQLEEAGAVLPDAPIPENIRDFEVWCQKHLTGAVDVLNRALQGVKKSEFEDVALIYRALLLLRDYYVPMKRRGGVEFVRKYQDACNALGITEEPTFSGERAGEEGDTYFVQYAGRRMELSRHLKKGNSREPRFCFRLYFFWDDNTEQVVVGWLPSHLVTRAS